MVSSREIAMVRAMARVSEMVWALARARAMARFRVMVRALARARAMARFRAMVKALAMTREMVWEMQSKETHVVITMILCLD